MGYVANADKVLSICVEAYKPGTNRGRGLAIVGPTFVSQNSVRQAPSRRRRWRWFVAMHDQASAGRGEGGRNFCKHLRRRHAGDLWETLRFL